MTTEVGQHQAAPWTPDVSTFGARLALVRQHMGWGNVKEAATACGLPAENWRRWERDGIEPKRMTTIAMAIATRTNCDYRWLVHGPGRGDSLRSTCYDPGARVVATVGQTTRRTTSIGHATTRPVRQTRPIVGASTRPLAAAVL